MSNARELSQLASLVTIDANNKITFVSTSEVEFGGLALPATDGSNGQVLTTDGAGNLSFTNATGGISNVVEDTTPQLGGDLEMGFNYVGSSAAYMKAYDMGTTSHFQIFIQGNSALTLEGNPFSNTANVTINDDLIVQGGDIILGGTGRIQGIDTVSADTDAANKLYVDTAVAGAGGSELTVISTKTLDNPNAYDTSVGDQFGGSVAISGNYAIAGAWQEEDGGFSSGKAYIFDTETGSLLHTLDNPNAYGASGNDHFAENVAISGNYAIVGASAEDDAGGTFSGKAYIFNVTTGNLVHTLDNPTAFSTSEFDSFGGSVAISGNYAIVGATGEGDAGGTSSGKAYIFNVTDGSLVHTLDNPNAYGSSTNDFFGSSVAISGNYAIVGARSEDDAGGTQSGKAYIYDISTFTTSTISSANYVLDNPNAYSTSASDFFGRRVAISGNYAIVSASSEDDAGGSGSGKAYIYDISTFTTSTISSANYVLDNPNAFGTSQSDLFGTNVGISGNYAIVTANSEDDAYSDSGKAYIYDISTFTTSTISSANYVLDNPTAHGTSQSDYFGDAVAISGNYVMVGVPYESDAGGVDSGKAYIFRTSGHPYSYSASEINSFAPRPIEKFAQSYTNNEVFN